MEKKNSINLRHEVESARSQHIDEFQLGLESQFRTKVKLALRINSPLGFNNIANAAAPEEAPLKINDEDLQPVRDFVDAVMHQDPDSLIDFESKLATINSLLQTIVGQHIDNLDIFEANQDAKNEAAQNGGEVVFRLSDGVDGFLSEDVYFKLFRLATFLQQKVNKIINNSAQINKKCELIHEKLTPDDKPVKTDAILKLMNETCGLAQENQQVARFLINCLSQIENLGIDAFIEQHKQQLQNINIKELTSFLQQTKTLNLAPPPQEQVVHNTREKTKGKVLKIITIACVMAGIASAAVFYPIINKGNKEESSQKDTPTATSSSTLSLRKNLEILGLNTTIPVGFNIDLCYNKKEVYSAILFADHSDERVTLDQIRQYDAVVSKAKKAVNQQLLEKIMIIFNRGRGPFGDDVGIDDKPIKDIANHLIFIVNGHELYFIEKNGVNQLVKNEIRRLPLILQQGPNLENGRHKVHVTCLLNQSFAGNTLKNIQGGVVAAKLFDGDISLATFKE